MESLDWVPADVDTDKPSAARVYDYYLGGAHNFPADRQLAEQIMAAYPDAVPAIRANRAFLRRTVQYLVDQGIRQFLDIGSGVPTVGHVHEVAQATAPESRVVYVDIDPIAVAHSRLILKDNDHTAVIQADVRQPEQILNAPELRLLDLDQPVAALVVALFHFIGDDEQPAKLVRQLTTPLVSGSYLALSHATADSRSDLDPGLDMYRKSGIDFYTRTHAEVAALFGDFELVEPGLVWGPQWRPERPEDVGEHPEALAFYGGVGRKP